jgi:hypothetical protein
MFLPNLLRHFLSFIILSLLVSTQVLAQQTAAESSQIALWPKVIPLENISITIYQPEAESFNGDILEVRSAFNIYDGTKLPIFGALWFSARVHIDRSNNSVFYENIKMVDVNFPDATTDKKEELRKLLDVVIPTWQFNSSLADFSSAVEIINVGNESSVALNNSPPNIFYEQTYTELVYIDGEPILEDVDNSSLFQYVVNTPYFIVHSSSDKYYYLKAGEWWYRTTDIYGDWTNIGAPTQSIIKLSERAEEHNTQSSNDIGQASSTKPKLIVTTHPAALIQTKGEPDFVSLKGTNILYAANSTNYLLKDFKTGEFYVLLSGRWYKSNALFRGNWNFVAPDSLPVYFKKIPGNALIGKSRVSIPGTPESMSAALDNAIPQTAIIDRKAARINVEYDGEPLFEAIKGTTLHYAPNTNISVLKTATNKYYAVDEAVWFTSDSPTENWVVATEIPEEINKIPPSSPVYNIKFVYIYDYSPEYVYVGYTGGYTGSFLYQGCLFYGTGYHYKPWYKSKYYSRPLTFAFGINRTGGNSKVSVSIGVGYGYGGYGYGGYGGYGYGGYGGYRGYGGYGGYGSGFGSYRYATLNGNYEFKKGYETKPLDPINIYNNRTQGVVTTAQVRRNDPFSILPDDQQGVDGSYVPPTNLYADKSGGIYKKNDEGIWQQRIDGVWVKSDGPTTNH